MAPKKVVLPTVTVLAEPNAVLQLPNDLPAECPFKVQWAPLVLSVLAPETMDIEKTRKALWKIHDLKYIQLRELLASLDSASPTAQEHEALLTAHVTAGNAPEAFSIPAGLVKRALQVRFDKDQQVAWKFEYVKRREAVNQKALDQKVAQEAVAAAEAALQHAQAEVLQARVAAASEAVDAAAAAEEPFPPAPPRTSVAAARASISNLLATNLRESLTKQLVPVTSKQQQQAEQLARAVAAAEEAEVHAAGNLADAQAAASAAAQALEAAQAALHSDYHGYQPYWLSEVPAKLTVERMEALLAADINIRAVVWLHGAHQDVPEAFAAMKRSTGASGWTDITGRVAVVDVTIGSEGTPFSITAELKAKLAAEEAAAVAAEAAAVAAAEAAAAAAAAAPPEKGAKGAAKKPAGKEAAPPPPPVPDPLPKDVPGLLELMEAARKLSALAVTYDDWCDAVKVFPLMPNPQASMNYYTQLMSSVPPEAESVPMILHAMLEQVGRNAQGEATMHDDEEASATLGATALLDRAFCTFHSASENVLLDGRQAPPRTHLGAIFEGDSCMAAAAGITTGYIHEPSLESPRSPLDVVQHTLEGAPGHAYIGSGIRPAHVAQDMLNLLQKSALFRQFTNDQHSSPIEQNIWRNSIQACSNGIPAGSVERYCLLRKAVLSLPEAVQEAHGDDILTRHHTEHLRPDLLTRALSEAFGQFPSTTTEIWEQGDASLVAFCASSDEVQEHQSVHSTLTFAEFVDKFVQNGGQAPVLAPAVYASEGRTLFVTSRTRFTYPADGSIIKSSIQQPFQLTKGNLAVSLAPQQQPKLLASTATGAMLAVLAVVDGAAAAAAAVHDAAGSAPEPKETVDAAAPSHDAAAAAAASVAGTQAFPSLASLHCYTPHGLLVELSTDGSVLIAACRDQEGAAGPHVRGVDVHGAPVEGADLSGQLAGMRHGWRKVNAQGCVTTSSKDGSIRVLHPDGSTSVWSPTPGAGWTRTNAVGERWTEAVASASADNGAGGAAATAAVPPGSQPAGGIPTEGSAEPPPDTRQPAVTNILSSTAHDPDSNAEITTRDDGVMLVRYSDGMTMVVDADGTRIIHQADDTWVVQADFLPVIHFDGASLVVAPCPDVSMAWSAASRIVTARDARSGAAVAVTAAGLASFSLSGSVPEQVLGYSSPPVQSGAHSGRAEELAKHADCQGIYIVDLAVPGGCVAMWESEAVHLDIAPSLMLARPVAPLATQQAAGGPLDTAPAAGKDAQPRQSPDPEAPASEQAEEDAVAPEDTSLLPAPVATIAPHVPPRLFVMHRSGDGYEILNPGQVNAYLQTLALDPTTRHGTFPASNSPEPGTLTHTILTTYAPVSPLLAPLQPGPIVHTQPYVADHTPVMPALRRPSVTATAASSGGGQPPAPFLPRILQGPHPPPVQPPAGTPVLVYREITELPPWGDALLAELEDVVQCKAAADEQRAASDASLEPVPDNRAAEEVAAESNVALQLQTVREAKRQRAEALAADVARQAAAAEVEAYQQRADDVARTAAMAAAAEKEHRPWPKKHVPFEDTPKRPPSGSGSRGVLRYFEAEEGILARAQDPQLRPEQPPVTKAMLPPRLPAPAASAGRMTGPGVYVSEQRLAELQEGPPSAADAATMTQGPVSPARASPNSTTRTLAPHKPPHPLPVDYTHPEMGRTSRPAAPPAATLAKTPAYDVYGGPRTSPIPLPAIYTPKEALLLINSPHIAAEGAALRLNRTAPMALIHTQGRSARQFQLSPAHLHFGTCAAGTVAHRTARLLNTSGERQRFMVVRPAAPLRVIYKPGPLAAGMEAVLTVEFVAERMGDFVGEVTVKSELNVLALSCSAKVVAGPAGGGWEGEGMGGGQVDGAVVE